MNHASLGSSPIGRVDAGADATCDDTGGNQCGNHNGNYNTDGHLGRVVHFVKIVFCFVAPLAMDCTSHSQEKESRGK